VDSFIPELEHLIENPSHRLFSTKKPLQSDSWIQIHELKLRSSNVIWISSKVQLEILFLNSLLEKSVWESGPKIDLATGVVNPWKMKSTKP